MTEINEEEIEDEREIEDIPITLARLEEEYGFDPVPGKGDRQDIVVVEEHNRQGNRYEIWQVYGLDQFESVLYEGVGRCDMSPYIKDIDGKLKYDLLEHAFHDLRSVGVLSVSQVLDAYNQAVRSQEPVLADKLKRVTIEYELLPEENTELEL